MNGALLTVQDVHAGYLPGVDILRGLSLSARPNEITLVIGPNGAGKSTLLRTVFALLAPKQGAITFRGESTTGMRASDLKAAGISYVTQDINSFPNLTVEENLRMGAWVFRRDRPRLNRQLDRAYTTFPALAEKRRVRAGELSGGQGRMLAVAREMMTEPALMLVDEPTAGLAPNLVDQVYELLLTAGRTMGSTILLVDQNIEQAVAYADHVYMVNLVRIKAEVPASDFPPERVAALIQECLLG